MNKYDSMNKIRYSAGILQIMMVSLLVGIVGCKKDESNELKLSRNFAPSSVTTALTETTVKISWPASLFTLPGAVTYQVDVSKDPSFSNIDYTVQTADVSTTVTETNIAVRQNYYARVKALGADGTNDSNYISSAAFKMTGEQWLYPIPATDATDVAVLVKWKVNPNLTRIVVTPAAGGTGIEVALTAPDHAIQQKAVTGLAQLTNYNAEIFQGTSSKGIYPFKTKATITGNIVDLSGTTGNPAILATTLPTAPPGSVIVLRRGEKYDINSPAYLFDKSLSIVTQLGFGTNYAIVRLQTNFNVAATNPQIDSIVFKDIIFKGNRPLFASYNNDYILNINAITLINRIRIENCTVKILRGVVRVQAASTGAKISNYIVNNCLIDSIREFAVASAFNASSITNITISNSTVYRVRRLIDHRVAGNSSITLSNCTFNEVVAGAAAATNAVIDFTPAAAGSTTITNCIFGKTWDETATGLVMAGFRAPSGSPNVVGSFNTTDFTNTTSPIPSLSAYSGTAAALFTDPNNGNFLIKDTNFVGRNTTGDPRWRIN
jgi:hypothetical protein